VDANLIGSRLGKYQIQAEIGRGGMGAVYKGYDPMLDRFVAVKVLAPHLVWEQEFVERFLREARAAARLKHPHIVTIHDVGQEAGWYYFVMEYLDGQPLRDVILTRGPLPLDKTLAILRPLAEALDYAHHRGIIHRDIKPANVIVSSGGQVSLTDFGIARAVQETRLTRTGTVVGTPEYMSPEQVRGLGADARSDLYSLAVVAYEMLSGKVPFEADSTLALLHKIAYEPAPPIHQIQLDLPAGIGPVLNKALAKDPGDRHPTASAFVDALAQAITAVSAEAPTPAPPPPEAAPIPISGRGGTKVMPDTAPPDEAPIPTVEARETQVLPDVEPIPTYETAPERVRARPDVALVAPTLHRLPVWMWALGGLLALGLVIGLAIGIQRALSPGPTSDILQTGPILPGARTTFVSNRDGKQEIYQVTGDGTAARITATPGDGESWSPAPMRDGTLLFASNRDGKQEIYHLTRDGIVERVTHTPGAGESWFAPE
jgi:serine/threonine-protein kinase